MYTKADIWQSKRWLGFVLVSVCFAAYANSLSAAFISDDIPAILRNPLIAQPLSVWIDPASMLNSFNYLFAGARPFIYHLTNIGLHSLNTVLVLFFLCSFFSLEASFLGACIFAVHPVHAEAVTWISGKPYLMGTLFLLANYLLYNGVTHLSKEDKKLIFSVIFSVFLSALILFYTTVYMWYFSVF